MISRADLEYALPPELVAQTPVRPRDASRVLVLERSSGVLDEIRFRDLPQRVGAFDLLVVNDTRVLPARLRGSKTTGGRAEALLLERQPDGSWLALVRARGSLHEGLRLCLGGLDAEVEEVRERGLCRLRFAGNPGAELLERAGEAPLPPYIRRPAPLFRDLEDYQSIFAQRPGAVAAPTASLHFTPELAARLRIARITLHVGPGTFRPVECERLEDHALEGERFCVPAATAEAIAETRERGGRVIAVGTTAVRALETTGGKAGSGSTELFVRPGYRFAVVDELITNLHLPCSTLLALVMAFAGVEVTRRAYAVAIERRFRFYSYGDAMWIR